MVAGRFVVFSFYWFGGLWFVVLIYFLVQHQTEFLLFSLSLHVKGLFWDQPAQQHKQQTLRQNNMFSQAIVSWWRSLVFRFLSLLGAVVCLIFARNSWRSVWRTTLYTEEATVSEVKRNDAQPRGLACRQTADFNASPVFSWSSDEEVRPRGQWGKSLVLLSLN